MSVLFGFVAGLLCGVLITRVRVRLRDEMSDGVPLLVIDDDPSKEVTAVGLTPSRRFSASRRTDVVKSIGASAESGYGRFGTRAKGGERSSMKPQSVVLRVVDELEVTTEFEGRAAAEETGFESLPPDLQAEILNARHFDGTPLYKPRRRLRSA